MTFFITMRPSGEVVHAVVDGGKGVWAPARECYGVQVVDQGLHGLIGGPVGLLHRPLVGEGLGLLHLLRRAEGGNQRGPLGGGIVPQSSRVGTSPVSAL